MRFRLNPFFLWEKVRSTSTIWSLRIEILEIEDDTLVNDIYFYIGTIAVSLAGLFSVVTLIRRCVKYYNHDRTVEDSKLMIFFYVQRIFVSGLVIPSNRLFTQPLVLQRQSSIRNPLIPNHRSSLDIRFQMESRGQRLLHSWFRSFWQLLDACLLEKYKNIRL